MSQFKLQTHVEVRCHKFTWTILVLFNYFTDISCEILFTVCCPALLSVQHCSGTVCSARHTTLILAITTPVHTSDPALPPASAAAVKFSTSVLVSRIRSASQRRSTVRNRSVLIRISLRRKPARLQCRQCSPVRRRPLTPSLSVHHGSDSSPHATVPPYLL